MMALFLMITGTTPQLMIIHYLTEPIVQLVYLCIWVKHMRILHRTLKWRTVEFQVRGRRQGLVRRSKITSHQFALIMCCVGMGYACFIFGEFLGQYFSIVASTLYYGPCILHYLYGVPYFQRLVATQPQIEAFNAAYVTSTLTTMTVFSFGVFLMPIQYILSTLTFFGRILSEKLKFRYGRVRTRFTPTLNQHLLPD